MLKLEKAFNSDELLKKINGDHVKNVVAILKDGSEFCAFVEIKESDLLEGEDKTQGQKEDKKKKVKNVPNP